MSFELKEQGAQESWTFGLIKRLTKSLALTTTINIAFALAFPAYFAFSIVHFDNSEIVWDFLAD